MVKSDGSRSSCSCRNASGNAGDLDAVPNAFRTERIGVEGLVGQQHHVAQGFEVADRCMNIDWLNRIAGEEADGS